MIGRNRGNNGGRNTNSRDSGRGNSSSRNNGGGRNANNRDNNNGIGLGRVAKSAAVATVVNRVVNNALDSRNNGSTRQGMNHDQRFNDRPGSNTPVRDIAEIRERTGASLGEAKGAYDRNNQNIEAAIRELMGHGHSTHHQQAQAITIGCPNCRTQNPEHTKFCSNCGGGLEPVRDATQPQVVQPQSVEPPGNCSGCKANLTGVTGNVCPYCRTAFR